MSKGYVYILSNPSMPNVIKVGRSTLGGSARASQLATSGVPTPFKLEFELYSEEHEWLESEVHKALSDSRVSPNREFFECSAGEAIIHIVSIYMSELSGTDYRLIDPLMYDGAVDLFALAQKLDLAPVDVFDCVLWLSPFSVKKAIAEFKQWAAAKRRPAEGFGF